MKMLMIMIHPDFMYFAFDLHMLAIAITMNSLISNLVSIGFVKFPLLTKVVKHDGLKRLKEILLKGVIPKFVFLLKYYTRL